MASLFCRFLDCPVSVDYKLQLFLPAKHRYTVELAHLQNSKINGRMRKPLHLTLFSKPSSPEVDVISKHEHPDGSLVFRFGDPSEVVGKGIETEESKTVVEEEKKNGAEAVHYRLKPVDSFSEEIVDQKLESEMQNVMVETNPPLEKSLESRPVHAQASPQCQVESMVAKETVLENLPVGTEAHASPPFRVELEVDKEPGTIFVEGGLKEENGASRFEKYPENLPADAEAQDSPQFQVESVVAKVTGTISMEQLKNENGASSIEMALGDNMGRFIVPEEERLEHHENVHIGHLLETSQPSVEVLQVAGEVISKKELALSSGAAILPHPAKVLSGGSDAYFISNETWIGIADGVGKWSLEGNIEGIYAQELMKTCERLISCGNDDSDYRPLELLSRSVYETQSPGSSTILISQFVGQSLHVANVGDSGFIVLRHGAVYTKSFPMNHLFHFPMHVQMGDDPSSLAQTYRVDLLEDDVIVTATDGLFDNLYDQEIALIVSNSLEQDKELQEVAEFLATKAQEIGRSASCRSPFSDDAHAAGYGGCCGGKLDDVVVIVSRVQRRSDSSPPAVMG